MTYSELVYMVMDLLKLSSDDSFYTQDHIIFLLNKFRTFILKQRYSDIKKQIPVSNYQEICMDLMEVPAISGECCEGGHYLRTRDKVPTIMPIGNPRVYPIDFYQGEITFISRDRMRYIGYNKYLQNIIYCSQAPDGYLYLKSWNPQFLYLENIRFNAIFEDAKEASELACPDSNGEEICDLIDKEFPIESALVPPLVELVIKELRGPEYSPKDEENNAKDDLSEVTVK
nr:MAG TPA: Structural protein [Crassvirales sp.]